MSLTLLYTRPRGVAACTFIDACVCEEEGLADHGKPSEDRDEVFLVGTAFFLGEPCCCCCEALAVTGSGCEGKEDVDDAGDESSEVELSC